jgi:hypothetical protein
MTLTGCAIRECPSSTLISSTSFVTPHIACFFRWNVEKVLTTNSVQRRMFESVTANINCCCLTLKKCTYNDQSNTTYFIIYSKRRHVSAFTKPSSGLPFICWRVVHYNARMNGIPYTFNNRCRGDTKLKSKIKILNQMVKTYTTAMWTIQVLWFHDKSRCSSRSPYS